MHIKYGKEGLVQILTIFEKSRDFGIAQDFREMLINKELFQGKKDQLYHSLGLTTSPIILAGLGKESETNSNDLRKLFYKIGHLLIEHKMESARVSLPNLPNIQSTNVLNAMIEGLLQTEYQFQTYKTEKKEAFRPTVFIEIPDDQQKEASRILTEVRQLVDGIFIARDLVNTPAHDMYPETLAQRAKEILEPLGIKVSIYDKKAIEEMKMEAFLSVAIGSDREPRFFVMEYLPMANEKPLVLVGKGLTYDSGGYALKPVSGMMNMKTDMSGASSVIGALYALAKNKIQKNVVGVVAACENMISGRSYKNGDIVSSMKGLNIEILNTDAEGRVTMADSLYYAAARFDSAAIVDIATLTGACIVALGNQTMGAITNDAFLYGQVEQAAAFAGEYLWKLPVFPETRKLIKGKVGDIVNSCEGGAGAITAGIFLEEFVEKKPWVHLDIAGPAFSKRGWGYLPRGATGIPVKTLYYLAKAFLPPE